MRVVLDTNVWVSGIVFGGVPLRILEMALDSDFDLVVSADIINEVESVLRSKKFGYSANEIRDVVQPLLDVADFVIPQNRVTEIKRCPADNRILECALEGKAEYIVTGDMRDLGKLGVFQGIKIISPRVFRNLFP